MPFGPAPLGAAAFIAIKFVGYRYAGAYLDERYNNHRVSVNVFGVARTALGLLVGITFALLMSHWEINREMLVWFLILLPVRIAEWVATIWFFFERKEPKVQPARLLKHSVLGAGWSYVLDIPAIAAVFVVPGGMWVC